MLKTRYVSVIAMLFLMATPALADDSADCKQTADPSLAIQACGKVIAAKKSKDDLVAAYAARGDAYLAKKDYDNAVSDYSEILTIDPTKTVAALTMRGNAYLANDNWHFALADLTSALKMTPPGCIPLRQPEQGVPGERRCGQRGRRLQTGAPARPKRGLLIPVGDGFTARRSCRTASRGAAARLTKLMVR
jgi:hypothetical protein